MADTFWVETLGCPKNQVDSDKLVGTLSAEGLVPAETPSGADLVVVNTCAFIEAARRESVDVILGLAAARKHGAKLVVTGCLAARYGAELAGALPEADLVAGFGVPVAITATRASSGSAASGPAGKARAIPAFDLLNLPRPPSCAPWAYVKVAEGCDRTCGFCAIPSFRGRQRSRTPASILAEVDGLDAAEIVLVAQDLASYGKDVAGLGAGAIVPLVSAVARRTRRVRLLYLYPSELSTELIDAIDATGVHYFDLSLQHASKPHLRRMRRWGDGNRFLDRIHEIRAQMPQAAFRSNFIVGYPGETEADQDELLAFIEAAQLDWCGFFAFSAEEGTYAVGLPDPVAPQLVAERLRELSELQDRVTAARRAALVGTRVEVLVDSPGIGRTHREAPEIDGVVEVPLALAVGQFADVVVTGVTGTDLQAMEVAVG